MLLYMYSSVIEPEDGPMLALYAFLPKSKAVLIIFPASRGEAKAIMRVKLSWSISTISKTSISPSSALPISAPAAATLCR